MQGRDAARPSAEWGAAPKTLDDFADRLLALQAAEARIHAERARLEAALAGLFDAAGVASVSFSTGRIIRVSGDPPCFEVQSKAEPGSPGAGSGDL
ncbi:hypothetical protein KKB55_11220 [Myxococcota bacterium]|nr:hypothetical protein [Myxococcota bacterium]